MSTVSLDTYINKNMVDSEVPMLVALEVDVYDPDTSQFVETLRVVRNNEDIELAGELYTASAFEISITTSSDEEPTMSLTVVDITQTIQKFMSQYRGANGSRVTAHFFFAPSTVVAVADTSYVFSVLTSSSRESDYSITWTIGAETQLNYLIPSRKQYKERCQWRYKGEECGYTGPLETCDLSLSGGNGCRAHDNQTRFGGYPGISVRNLS